jgi:hypothetical protein
MSDGKEEENIMISDIPSFLETFVPFDHVNHHFGGNEEGEKDDDLDVKEEEEKDGPETSSTTKSDNPLKESLTEISAIARDKIPKEQQTLKGIHDFTWGLNHR